MESFICQPATMDKGEQSSWGGGGLERGGGPLENRGSTLTYIHMCTNGPYTFMQPCDSKPRTLCPLQVPALHTLE